MRDRCGLCGHCPAIPSRRKGREAHAGPASGVPARSTVGEALKGRAPLPSAITAVSCHRISSSRDLEKQQSLDFKKLQDGMFFWGEFGQAFLVASIPSETSNGSVLSFDYRVRNFLSLVLSV